MDEPNLQYRRFVYRFALQLNDEDRKALAWIYKHVGVSSCTSALDILTKLEEHGYFSVRNPHGLVEVAKSVYRKDLETLVKEYTNDMRKMTKVAKKSCRKFVREEGKNSANVVTHDISAQATAVVNMLQSLPEQQRTLTTQTMTTSPPKSKMHIYNLELFSAYEALLQHINVLVHVAERLRVASTKQDPEEQRTLGAQASGDAIPHAKKIEQQLRKILSDCGVKVPFISSSSELSTSLKCDAQSPPCISSVIASLQLRVADLTESRAEDTGSPTYETIPDHEQLTEDESDDEESFQLLTCSTPVPESNKLYQSEASLPVFAKDLPPERPIYTFLKTHCIQAEQRMDESEPILETNPEKLEGMTQHQTPESAFDDCTEDSGFTDLLPLLQHHFASTTGLESGPSEPTYMPLQDSTVNQDAPYANTIKKTEDLQ